MKTGDIHVYLGTITQPVPFAPGARGAGIVGCALDPASGLLEPRSVTGGILNPNYLAADEGGGNLFAITCDLEAGCHVHAYRRGADGRLAATGVQPTGARVGCHICALPGGRVCATSYFDSSIAVFPVRDGALGPREFHVRYEGRGVNASRQEDSHAHQAVVSPDGRWLYVCDLGTDRIWCHAIGGGRVGPASPDSAATPAGCGPRHLAFHPRLARAYVICELNAHVLTYDWRASDGRLSLLGDAPSLPSGWKGEPAGAAIRAHPSGAALYVSNRNHDSLDFFTLDREGRPARAGHIASGGECPRDFGIDPSGRWLLAANQNSNNVAVHELDPETGLPAGRAPGIFPVDTPASVLLVR
jgi:6-phosphogluconolactonase